MKLFLVASFLIALSQSSILETTEVSINASKLFYTSTDEWINLECHEWSPEVRVQFSFLTSPISNDLLFDSLNQISQVPEAYKNLVRPNRGLNGIEIRVRDMNIAPIICQMNGNISKPVQLNYISAPVFHSSPSEIVNSVDINCVFEMKPKKDYSLSVEFYADGFMFASMGEAKNSMFSGHGFLRPENNFEDISISGEYNPAFRLRIQKETPEIKKRFYQCIVRNRDRPTEFIVSSGLSIDHISYHHSPQMYIFGGSDENNRFLETASRMNSSTGSWQAINSMPTVETQFCGAVSDSKIYLFGGLKGKANDSKALASADVYDYLTDTYSMLRAMPEHREGCGAATLNDSIYVSGGTISSGEKTDFSANSSLVRYDIKSNQWVTLNPMNVARRAHQLVELGGLLYAIGGKGQKSAEVYNVTTDRWSSIADSHYVQQWSGATVFDGKIYVLGKDGFEVYSPSTNQWIKLTLPNDHEYDGRTLVTMSGKLWAVGGQYEEESVKMASKSVFTYDPATDRWTKEHDMDVYRRYHAAFVVDH